MQTKQHIQHMQTELSGHTYLDGFMVSLKTRKRSIYHKQSARTAKSNKIARCSAIADNMPETFARIVKAANRAEFIENRAEEQRNARRAKRNK